MKMRKALIIASVASMIDQFNMDNIKLLRELGYQVDVACNFEFGSSTSQERVSKFQQELTEDNIRTYHIPIPRKITNLKRLFESYRILQKLVHRNNYEIIHCHSPIGGVIARLASRKVRESGTRVLYTAHGFHFFKGSSIKNWILFYPIERWLMRYTDVLITINNEDFSFAKKTFGNRKIEYIPGVGIDTNKLNNYSINQISKRKELNLSDNAFVILSVGELNKNKNHETIIRAISKLENKNIYYVICGKGILESYLENLILDLGLERQVKLLGYRTDVSDIYQASDVFAFPSKREGLGLAALEAMASGLPIITSNIHGIVDYSVDGETGYCCAPEDVDGFANAIMKLYKNRDMVKKMSLHNLSAVKKFDLENVRLIMEKIYSAF